MVHDLTRHVHRCIRDGQRRLPAIDDGGAVCEVLCALVEVSIAGADDELGLI